MAEMIKVDEGTFQNEVLDANEPVLVDFSAVWCQPCKMLDPVVKQLAGEWEGKVKERVTGFMPREKLIAKFSPHFN